MIRFYNVEVRTGYIYYEDVDSVWRLWKETFNQCFKIDGSMSRSKATPLCDNMEIWKELIRIYKPCIRKCYIIVYSFYYSNRYYVAKRHTKTARSGIHSTQMTTFTWTIVVFFKWLIIKTTWLLNSHPDWSYLNVIMKKLTVLWKIKFRWNQLKPSYACCLMFGNYS